MKRPTRTREGWVAATAVAAVIAIGFPADAANGGALRVAVIRGDNLWVIDLRTHAKHVVLTHPIAGPVHWSGDGRLVSSGGRIVGGPALPTGELVWAPKGELAAGVTPQSGVVVWTPQGTTQLEPDGWGSTSVAWSETGRLAIGRTTLTTLHGRGSHPRVTRAARCSWPRPGGTGTKIDSGTSTGRSGSSGPCAGS
jgi:hypothetical protein